MLYLGLKSDVGTFQRYIAKVQLISAHKKLVGQDEAQDTKIMELSRKKLIK